jgi:hypothetical protein
MKKITTALVLVVGLSINAQAQSDLIDTFYWNASAGYYTFEVDLDYDYAMSMNSAHVDADTDPTPPPPPSNPYGQSDSPTSPNLRQGEDIYNASTTDCTSKFLMGILLSQDDTICEPIQVLWEIPDGEGKTKLLFRVTRPLPVSTSYTLSITRVGRTDQVEVNTMPAITVRNTRLDRHQVVLFTMPDNFAEGSLEKGINQTLPVGITPITVACTPSGSAMSSMDDMSTTTRIPYIQLSASDTFEGSSCIPGTVVKYDNGLRFTPQGAIGAGLYYTRALFSNGQNGWRSVGATTLNIE